MGDQPKKPPNSPKRNPCASIFPSRKLGVWIKESKHRSYAVCFIFILLFYVLFIWNLPRAEVLSVASVLTEKISFEDPSQKSAFPIYGMRASVSSGPDSPIQSLDHMCVDGLFKPLPYAKVTYGRTGQGPLEIEISRGSLRSDSAEPVLGVYEPRSGDRSIKIAEPIYFEWDKECAAGHLREGGMDRLSDATPPPLPLWGNVSIGGEFRPIVRPGLPEPRLLLSGQLRVSAHSILIPFIPIVFDKQTIYPVTNIDLPVGSRLIASSDSNGGAKGLVTNWWGTAYVDPGKPALVVEVATNADELLIYHANLSHADVIEVATLNQIFNDPQILRIQFLIGIFASICGIIFWFLDKKFEQWEKGRLNAPTDVK